jgi:hypothetical protein
MTRKTFIKRIAQLAALSAIPAFYSSQVEPFWVEFVQRNLPIKNLPKNFEGKILMQISDLHVGNRFDWHFLIDCFKEAKAFNPDIVVYTGDYVSWETEEQLQQLESVMKRAVKGKMATLGILGNHDYGEDWLEVGVSQNICQVLEKNGLTMLNNQQIDVEGLNILGFEDLWSPNFNPMQVMKDYDSQKANLVLCHNPDVCDLDVWNGYQGWILSGHTHGGQVSLPLVGPPLIPVKNKKYTSGEIDLEDGRMLYINRALGHSHQIRFLVRPEITVFKLIQG